MTMQQITYADARIFLYSAVLGIFEKFFYQTSLDYGEYCATWKGTTAEEWMDQEKMHKCSLEILERERESPGYMLRIISAYEQRKKIYLDFVDELKNIRLRSLSDEQLLGHYGTFMSLYTDEFSLAVLPLIYKEHLSEMLYKSLEPRLGDKTAEILSCITTPEKESFSYEQRKSMLGTMAAIYDAGGKKLFDEKNPEDIIVALKEDHHDAYEEIVNHSRRYLWINNNYRRAVVLGPLDFIIKMKDESISFNHPSDELSLMEETKKTTIEKKKEYLSLLEEDEKLMAELLAEGTWLQDERKRCNLIGDHVLTEFLKELSARTGVSLDILHNASVFEFGAILNGKADIDAIARRHEDYFTIYTEYSLKHRKLVAGPGRRYDVSDVEHTDEFRGTPASLGKTEGKVVVITKEEDFGKMKDGAILVSVMTRPEYTPLMKRASGIITDEGGLTCHAAVVSREFKIPCIVGTRHATRILKDGDIVELDAAKGLVRLKRP